MLDILLKDIKLMLSDRKSLALIILMPIVLTSILSFALSGSFQETGNEWKLKIGIVKRYNEEVDREDFMSFMSSFGKSYGIDTTDMESLSDISGEFNPENMFFDDFLGNNQLQSSVEYEVLGENEAYELLEDKDISAIIILPERFVYDSYVNVMTTFRNNTEIRVVSHPDMRYSGQITEELVKAFNTIMSSISISKNVFLDKSVSFLGIEKSLENLELFMDRVKMEDVRSDAEITEIRGKNYIDSFAYYSVAMMSMFILFSAGYGGKFILDEKKNTTYYRMLAAGISKNKIIAGKFIMMSVIVIIQSSVLILFSSIVLGISWINIPLILLTIILSSFGVASIGSLIIAITMKINSYKAVDAFTSAIVQAMAFLGGSYIPLEVLPEAVGDIGRLTLNGAVLKAYIRILEGYGFQEILPVFGIIAANIVLFTLVSILLLGGEDRYAKSADA
jgi:ABC-2 type transport system permease protein